jgi:CubicO group peptidase (beta-lactamase class C family)
MARKLVVSALFIWGSLSHALTAAPPERVERDVMPRVLIENRKREPVTLEQRMSELRVPGVSLAFFDGGEVAWARAYGLADVEQEIPVTTQTLFQAASISKPISATAALDLVEEGLLDLDTDVNTWLTSWKLQASDINRAVTLRGLLSHTAGVTVQGFPGYGPDEVVPSLVEILNGKGNTPGVVVDQTPRMKYRYSGGGYIVIQQLIVEATEQPFAEVLDQRVLRPLGMGKSTFQQPLPQKLHAKAATGYRPDLTPVPGRFHTYPEQSPAGLWSTPADLARWAMAIQLALAGGPHPVLNRSTVQDMVRADPVSRGGLGLGLPHNGVYFAHGGANEGFQCQLTAKTRGQQGLVVMTNSDRGSILAAEILLTIADEYGWTEYQPIRKRVIELDASQLGRLSGSYRAQGRPKLVVNVVGESGSLTAVRQWDKARLSLLPESETRFFVPADGSLFVFSFNNNESRSFEASGLRFEKVDE